MGHMARKAKNLDITSTFSFKKDNSGHSLKSRYTVARRRLSANGFDKARNPRNKCGLPVARCSSYTDIVPMDSVSDEHTLSQFKRPVKQITDVVSLSRFEKSVVRAELVDFLEVNHSLR
jgi:hypothetical protein